MYGIPNKYKTIEYDEFPNKFPTLDAEKEKPARKRKMKYLPLEPLEELNGGLSCIDVGDARIYGRLEAYSCKNTRDDNRLKVHMDAKYEEEQQLKGGASSLEPKSPFGPFQETSRKTLFFLLATLNAVYPDYDFSDVSPGSFCKLPTLSMVANSIHHLLFVPLTNAHAPDTGTLESTLWGAVDEALTLDQCDFYAYNPDKESEPDCEEAGNLWSFYYFFFNKKQKRMLFFTARAVSSLIPDMDKSGSSEFIDPDLTLSRGSPSSQFDEFIMGQME